MPERIPITKETYSFQQIFAGQHELVLKVKKEDDLPVLIQQILDDQEKASFRDYLVEQYWYKEIRNNGTNWYDELKVNSEKWNKFSSQCIIKITDDVTTIEPIINKELELENKQLKISRDDVLRLLGIQNKKLEQIEGWISKNDNVGITNQAWTELKQILNPIAPELQAKLDSKKKLFSENTS